MSTIRILLGIFCLVVIGCSNEPNSSILVAKPLKPTNLDADSNALRKNILKIACSQIGVMEASGKNDGTEVESYLKITGLLKGNPWCAAFVSWTFAKAGFAKPRTAWSPALFPIAKRTLVPKPADVLGIYSVKLKRIAHAGIVESRYHNWIISVEGVRP